MSNLQSFIGNSLPVETILQAEIEVEVTLPFQALGAPVTMRVKIDRMSLTTSINNPSILTLKGRVS